MNVFSKKKANSEYKNIKDKNLRKKYGETAGIVGIVTNFVLVCIKLAIGILSSSVAIIADALNNLSDAGSSFVSLISFKISSKPADKEHPFGHARMEYISSMIVSFLIMLVGVELLSDSGKKILGIGEAVVLNITTLTIIILAVSILIKLALGIFYFSVARKIDSSVVRASGVDSISDCVSTGAILISSIIIKYTSFTLLDSIVGLAVAVMIIIAGAKILIETKNKLLGEGPVKETVEAIMDIVKEYPEILGVHDVLVHNYGPNTFISSFHAEVDGKGDFMHLHDMIDNCEKEITTKLGILCTIHLDPIVTDDAEVIKYKQIVHEALSEIKLDYPIHDFRVVAGKTHTNLIFDIVLPFEVKLSEAEIMETISAAIKKRDEKLFCVITIDRG